MKSFFHFNSQWPMFNVQWSMFNPISRWRERRQQKKALKARQQLLQTYALLEKIFDSGQLSFDPKSRRLFITQPLASLLMAKGADAWINSIHTIYQYTYLRQSQKAWDEYMQREELAAVREAMSNGQSSTIDHEPLTIDHSAGAQNNSQSSTIDHEPLTIDHSAGAQNNSQSQGENGQSSIVNGPLGPTGRLRSGAEQEFSMVNGQSSTVNGQLSRSDIDRIRLARRQQIAFSDMEPPKVEPFEFFIIPLSTEAKVEPLAVGYYDPNTGQMDVATWDDVKTLLSDRND